MTNADDELVDTDADVDVVPKRLTSFARLADDRVCDLELRRRQLSETTSVAVVARPLMDRSSGPSSSCTRPFSFKFTGCFVSSLPLAGRSVLRSSSTADDSGTVEEFVIDWSSKTASPVCWTTSGDNEVQPASKQVDLTGRVDDVLSTSTHVQHSFIVPCVAW